MKLESDESLSNFAFNFNLRHYNPGAPSARALTCILYLNPGWAPGDGGELQLTPFMQRPVRVAPLCDRLAWHSLDTACTALCHCVDFIRVMVTPPCYVASLTSKS